MGEGEPRHGIFPDHRPKAGLAFEKLASIQQFHPQVGKFTEYAEEFALGATSDGKWIPVLER